MRDDASAPLNPDEATENAMKSLAFILDVTVETFALERALIARGLLTEAEVQTQAVQIEQAPAIRELRRVLGRPSLAVAELLRTYKGPVQ